ncbi:hypothetical protein [Nocardioides pelophilus]|uniref:hypothetical protein n=1 Tax=Nocardioides pelophilus TaxID=2172019 RepID=UPI001603FBA9|nr:hypothetical protein [Nocardioides pelophilus]
MNLRILTAATVGAAVLGLTACTSASHRAEADELGDRLRDLPGVETVEVDYVEPELLDSADVDVAVVMTGDADPEQVAAVFETTYAGLVDAHADEEGNLTVRWDDDELTLRTFESEADPADVADAAQVGAEVAASHRRVYLNVMTQDVRESPHVKSLVLLRLPAGTEAVDRRRVRDEIAAAYGDRSVVVDVRIRAR